MKAKSFPRLLMTGVLLTFGALRVAAAADPPTAPGVAFDSVSVAAGQTARLTAQSVGPGNCGGGVALEFFSADVELLKKTIVPDLQPGKAASLELSHDEMQSGSSRTEVRAVLRFGWDKAYPPSPQALRLYECKIQPKLEILENATGKIILVSTDTKRLPERVPPRK